MDDSIELLKRIPQVGAIIYAHKYHKLPIISSNPSLDWASNFSHMLGYNSTPFYSFMKLNSIFSDD